MTKQTYNFEVTFTQTWFGSLDAASLEDAEKIIKTELSEAPDLKVKKVVLAEEDEDEEEQIELPLTTVN